MKTYLVGGAVRDALLELPVVDRDWVVVGSTPDELLAAGYKAVGRDFPVFLHPETHEEYALARTERKTAPGYRGFVFNTDRNVTLEDDLSRRDLTVNAIAQSADGEFIDPFNGRADLEARVLRHVSEAFVEDPVRVLRVARFMARLAPFGFSVAADTLELMRAMVSDGEVRHLVAERVWQELELALAARAPRAFFDTLRACSALAEVIPEVEALFGVPQPAKWHPEIDSGVHTLMVLEQACDLSPEVETRFAALCHDLGKATTPPDEWPSHHGHEERGAAIAETMCARLRVSNKARDLAVLTARFHTHCHSIAELRSASVVSLLQSLDVMRKPERFEQFLLACEADARGRLGFESHDYPQAAMLASAADVFCNVDSAAIAADITGEDKSAIPEAIRLARIDAISQWRKRLA